MTFRCSNSPVVVGFSRGYNLHDFVLPYLQVAMTAEARRQTLVVATTSIKPPTVEDHRLTINRSLIIDGAVEACWEIFSLRLATIFGLVNDFEPADIIFSDNADPNRAHFLRYTQGKFVQKMATLESAEPLSAQDDRLIAAIKNSLRNR